MAFRWFKPSGKIVPVPEYPPTARGLRLSPRRRKLSTKETTLLKFKIRSRLQKMDKTRRLPKYRVRYKLTTYQLLTGGKVWQ
jgi:hypothetical protein